LNGNWADTKTALFSSVLFGLSSWWTRMGIICLLGMSVLELPLLYSVVIHHFIGLDNLALVVLCVAWLSNFRGHSIHRSCEPLNCIFGHVGELLIDKCT
jgi:hypothetical protein